MNWIVQNAMFGDEFGYDSFIAAIDYLGQNRIIVDYAFWEATIDLKVAGLKPESILPFGTRSFVKFGMRNGWTIPWNNSYEYYTLLALGEDFINHDMQVDILDNLKVPGDGKVYIREAAGFNIVKGKVISGYAWPDWVNGFKTTNHVSVSYHDWHKIDGDSLFIWAPVKKIFDEYRVWVVDKRVVSSSQYVNKGEIEYTNSDDNWEVNHYAQVMVDKLDILCMDNFVIDIFRTEKGLKVGEINCMPCSGWYAIDACKVVEELVKYYEKNNGKRSID
jgi:hypothetical protein